MKKQIKNALVCALATICAGSVVAFSGCDEEDDKERYTVNGYSLNTVDLEETWIGDYDYILVDGVLHSGSVEWCYARAVSGHSATLLGYKVKTDCDEEIFTTTVSMYLEEPAENVYDHKCEECFPSKAK